MHKNPSAAEIRSLAEEAADLEAIVADRFPGLSPQDRAQFCASTLRKVACLYQRGANVILAVVDDKGEPTGGWQALLIQERRS
jgi:hypothetical protein